MIEKKFSCTSDIVFILPTPLHVTWFDGVYDGVIPEP